jgi:hypothetical protein
MHIANHRVITLRSQLPRAAASVLVLLLTAATPGLGAAESKEAERLERMERAIQQLQQQNAELVEKVRVLESPERSVAGMTTSSRSRPA